MKNKQLIAMYIIVSLLLMTVGCKSESEEEDFKYNYGVFLSCSPEEKEVFQDYKTIVIDSQYFSRTEINELKDEGHIVYSYINVGSIEKFRSYYSLYEEMFIGVYENWEDEQWIDVSQMKWQLLVKGLADEMIGKGIDGFFVDNCDVYDYVVNNCTDINIEPETIYQGLNTILSSLVMRGTEVVINGGDTYINAFREEYGSASKIMTAVNQESVFTSIDFENNILARSTADDQEYFEEFLKDCKEDSMKVYLLEYTSDAELINKIDEFCKQNDYEYYVTDSIDLD